MAVGLGYYVITYSIVNELRELRLTGFQRYISNPRNQIDGLYVLCYLAYVIFATVMLATGFNDNNVPDPTPIEQGIRFAVLFIICV